VNAENIIRCVGIVLEQKDSWYVPPEYLVENVSDTVIKLLHGYI